MNTVETNSVSPHSSNALVGSRIIGRYMITYHNGVTQEKDLISHTDYENIVKPLQDQIHDLETEKKDKEAGELKRQLKQMFGDNWFTDKSPIYEALKTGVLSLPQTQGGQTTCKVEAV